jgi:hypothetical protein
MPYTTIVAGTYATASWANANVRDQTIAQFDSTTDRDSAITSPVEGMVCITQDSGLMWIYTGSAWIQYGSYGGWTAWTPVMSSTGTAPTLGTGNTSSGRYVRMGNTIHGWGRILIGSAATAVGTGDYTFTLPVNFRNAGFVLQVGSLFYVDSSATSRVTSLQTSGATNLTLALDGTGIISATSPGIGVNDQIRYSFTYEAA